MTAAVRDAMAGAVDYAGLFPPAALDMETAAASYASYRDGAQGWMLGRFVLPAARIEELSRAAAPLGGAWRVSVLVGPDVEADRARIAAAGAQGITVESVEARTPEPEAVVRFREYFADSIEIYCEIPVDSLELLEVVHSAGARAKVRTGGITADAFPAPSALAEFVAACARAGLPFKTTAGLHHPARGDYPLTYEPGCGRASMYGFLNLIAATALALCGAPVAELVRALEERSAAELAATPSLELSRRIFSSFGSCSFTEPVEELASLDLL